MPPTATPDATDRFLNRALLIGVPVVALALLIIVVQATHRDQAREMQQLLATLTARDVVRVAVVPELVAPAPPTSPHAATLTDPAAIGQLLAAYRYASPYGPGGGRFSGGWEAQVDFYLRTGQVIHTTAFQNDLACLLFIVPPTQRSASNPDDCLMSQTAGRLLVQLTQPAH